ncbi:hypothetical protein DPMN_104575 [Dreissena polymorpha]|uniref:Uncharacterized protein n=1 Tax=Dreissena polymorpha TaxID=45954 RepID=A0A9D4HAR0_DREPO|nr:hypothetical protein DPMN_104575 [Dreissena polymorpha]
MVDIELDYELQRSWVSTIPDMMNEGPKIILRLPNIRKSIIAHPEPLLWYCRRRTELELLELINMNRCIHCKNDNRKVDGSDVMLQAIKKRRVEIIMDVVFRMYLEGSEVHDPYDVLKSILM